MTNQNIQNANRSGNDFVKWLAMALGVVAILVGWFVPEFYDWTGADQSRPAPIVGWIGLGILIADLLLFLLLGWLHFSQRVHPQEVSKRGTFGILHIMIIMTGVAVFLMLGRLVSMHIACRLLQTLVVGVAIWIAVQYSRTRFWIAWTAFLQFAPFLWAFRNTEFLSIGPSMLAFLTNVPALLPAALFVQPNNESTQWLLTLITTIEFATCLWLCYLGPKRALAGGIVVLTISIFSSFVLNALMRM